MYQLTTIDLNRYLKCDVNGAKYAIIPQDIRISPGIQS